MNIIFPINNKHKDFSKQKKKILKGKIVCGVYPLWDLPQDTVMHFKWGHRGWNLFVNPHHKHLADAADFILKHKKIILFIMKNVVDGEINIVESNR